MVKRTFDIVISLIGIVILFPLGLFITLVILAGDRGSVFFSQKRIGQNQQPFTLYKFRSMTVKLNSDNDNFDAGDQTRVTRIGKILRKTKLDELPQLINVLRGDMSMVGPRPEIKKWVDVYPRQWAFVLTVKPGITDNAAILFRNEEEILARASNPDMHYKEIILPAKLSIYSDYIRNHSFKGDILILIKTFLTVIKK